MMDNEYMVIQLKKSFFLSSYDDGDKKINTVKRIRFKMRKRKKKLKVKITC